MGRVLGMEIMHFPSGRTTKKASGLGSWCWGGESYANRTQTRIGTCIFPWGEHKQKLPDTSAWGYRTCCLCPQGGRRTPWWKAISRHTKLLLEKLSKHNSQNDRKPESLENMSERVRLTQPWASGDRRNQRCTLNLLSVSLCAGRACLGPPPSVI